MTRRVDLDDPDNPEWSEADFAGGHGPDALSPVEIAAFRRTRARGRPPLAEPKQAVSLRLSPAVVRHFRSTGPGWQARIDEVLKAAIPRT